MKLAIISADGTIYFFIEYAPQKGKPDAEKNAFWQLLDTNASADDYIVTVSYLNGYVGQKAGDNHCHGGKGCATHNKGGESIIDFANIMLSIHILNANQETKKAARAISLVSTPSVKKAIK